MGEEQRRSEQAAFQQAKQRFEDFIDQDWGYGTYKAKIRNMLERGSSRLIVNLNDLRAFDPQLTLRYIPAFEEVVAEAARSLQEKELPRETGFFVGFEGSFGPNLLSPRTLVSRFIHQLLCVEGIVTRCSLVRPKLVRTVHYCEATKKFISRDYRDATSATPLHPVTSFAYPTKDDQGNPLTTEFGLSVYKDHQTITVQEMPERAPPGQLPRSVEVVLDNDLVDCCKPGDRVQVMGVYMPLPSKNINGSTKSIFRTVLVANNLRLISKDSSAPLLTDHDIEIINREAQREDIFERLSASLAPSIYGHEYVKQALLLMLMGGRERVLENGTHLRGDINILLVGDPSTAKSQLLRFVLNIAPLAVSTNGRGSSGVGLTAAVTTDSETGERRLEAGAMVLADRGVVCIDEFDKMSPDDRVAIHEVMEQQTVTIAKAGIHATLNARCSVLAAANPLYGKYNRQKRPTENIPLPDSLLSRFDLLFIILDIINPDSDRRISEHVIRMHRYRPSSTEAASLLDGFDSMELDGEEDERTPVFQKFDATLHGRRMREVYSIPFIRKYILYAKNRAQPILTERANDLIAEAYAKLRSKDEMKTLPITARTLETLIRLSTAHARVCLRNEIIEKDVEAAIRILNFALYQETLSANENGLQPSAVPDAPLQQHPDGSHKRPAPDDAQDDIHEDDSVGGSAGARSVSQPVTISSERRKLFNEKFKAVTRTMKPPLSVAAVTEAIEKQGFSKEEIRTLLAEMASRRFINYTDQAKTHFRVTVL